MFSSGSFIVLGFTFRFFTYFLAPEASFRKVPFTETDTPEQIWNGVSPRSLARHGALQEPSRKEAWTSEASQEWLLNRYKASLT